VLRRVAPILAAHVLRESYAEVKPRNQD
jgi:hypothetical protein